MERVIHLPYFLARATTSDFCFGDTLQHTTEAANRQNEKKELAVVLSDRAKVSVGPSITTEIRLP